MGLDAGMDMGMNAAAGMGAAGIVTVLKYVLITLGGGVLLGIVFGVVIAGIKYPNPNKRVLFSPVQKIIVIIVAVLGIAMVIYAFTKKPGSSVPADAEASMGQMVDENVVPLDTPVLDGEGDGAATADSTEGDDSAEAEGDETASDDSSESEESSSSSVSSAAASSKATTANANANAAPRASFRKSGRSGMVIVG